MSIAEKIIKASENVSKVYEAGQYSMVDESKLIHQNVSGAYISLDDVSEIPHKIECRINSGSVAPETVRVIKFGKNLIPYPYRVDTKNGFFDAEGKQTRSGITATDLGDGGVLLNGTATGTAFIHLHYTNIGNLFLEGKNTFNIGGTECTIIANKYSNDIRTTHHNTNHLTYIVISAGTVCDNIVFYPQIEVGAKETEYEKGIPYQAYTPDADGLVEGMTSASPYMNLFCNTADVTLDVAYNKSYGIHRCEETHEDIKAESFAEGKQAEHDRFWDNFQNYGKTTNYKYAFTRNYWNEGTFRPKYDIRPIAAESMFTECFITDLVGILKECGVTLDFSNCKNMSMAFYWCTKITTLPVIDTTATQNDTNTFYYLFGNDTELRSIEKIILKETGEQVFSGTFSQCENLKEIRFEGVIGQTLDMSMSPLLSKDSIISIVNALSETASGKKLSLSKTAVNNAFGININNEGTYPEGSEYYTLRHSKDNWTFSYV